MLYGIQTLLDRNIPASAPMAPSYAMAVWPKIGFHYSAYPIGPIPLNFMAGKSLTGKLPSTFLPSVRNCSCEILWQWARCHFHWSLMLAYGNNDDASSSNIFRIWISPFANSTQNRVRELTILDISHGVRHVPQVALKPPKPPGLPDDFFTCGPALKFWEN